MTKAVANKIYRHDLQAGDHVIRWTQVLMYPIQVHGIVLSVGEGIVTLVDFGLSAPPPSSSKGQTEQEATCEADQIMHACEEGTQGNRGVNHHSKNTSSNENQLQRAQILVLLEEHDIKKWKRVDYGEERVSMNDLEDDTDTGLPTSDQGKGEKKYWWTWSSSFHPTTSSLGSAAEES